MKGSPGGILALAIGAIFLALGWNGRYVAVWEALRTGESQTIGDGGGGGTVIPLDPNIVPNPGNGNVAVVLQDPVEVTLIRTNEKRRVEAADLLKRAGENNRCALQEDAVQVPSGTVYCIANDKHYPLAMGGQVVDRNSTRTLIPTGTFAVRHQPNVIGLFDVD